MVDLDTFVTWLYVTVDELCKAHLPPAPPPPGRRPSLAPSEVITLGILGQWACFRSERAFYRYADRHLRAAFPQLPHRAQCNRLLRAQQDAITRFALGIARELAAPHAPYEVLDCTAARTRNAKRRGHGWLVGQAAIGYSNRLGWYEGLKLLLAVTPTGVITGWGCGAANADDRALAATLFALRDQPDARLRSVGQASRDDYLADAGFFSSRQQRLWAEELGVEVLAKPQGKRHAWPTPMRRLHTSLRQIVETVNDCLLETFRLDHDRPHHLRGFQARLAAKIALHNFCIWLNRTLGRPSLATADLIAW